MNDDAPARSPWRIYGLIAGAIALSTINFTVVFVAFSEIEKSFDASPSTVSWALTAFSITTAAVFVPAGWAADRFGRARMFLLGFGLFIFGSALVALSPTVEFLIFARVVQAAGLAIESPASLALVLDEFPVERRSTAVGALGAVGGVAIAVGPAVGGALIDLPHLAVGVLSQRAGRCGPSLFLLPRVSPAPPSTCTHSAERRTWPAWPC